MFLVLFFKHSLIEGSFYLEITHVSHERPGHSYAHLHLEAAQQPYQRLVIKDLAQEHRSGVNEV